MSEPELTPADLRAFRNQYHLTQHELADALDLHLTTISRMEQGSLPIHRPRLLSLALAALAQRLGRKQSRPRAKPKGAHDVNAPPPV